MMLDEAFTLAMSWQVLDDRAAAFSEMQNFLTTVEDEANQLLDTLRIPHPAPHDESLPQTHDWFLHIAPGLYMPDPPALWQAMADSRHRHFFWGLALKAGSSEMDEAEPERRGERIARAGSEAVLVAVPMMLRTLAATARLARERHAELPQRTGRRISSLNATLFPVSCACRDVWQEARDPNRRFPALGSGRELGAACHRIGLRENPWEPDKPRAWAGECIEISKRPE